MKSDTGIAELAAYIGALSDAERSAQSQDQSRYRDHLATAALIFERLVNDDIASAKKLVAEERRSFGWDFLPGDAGYMAESAFARFADFIEHL